MVYNFWGSIMLVIPMVERFCLRKKVLKIGLWHKLRPMCVLFLVLVWGGGIHFLSCFTTFYQKKLAKLKAVYHGYTAPCLTKIYYFFITRFITSSFGSNGFWWVSFFKESLKTALLTLY